MSRSLVYLVAALVVIAVAAFLLLQPSPQTGPAENEPAPGTDTIDPADLLPDTE